MSSGYCLIHRSCIAGILFSVCCSLSLRRLVSLRFEMIRSLNDLVSYPQALPYVLADSSDFVASVQSLSSSGPSSESLLSFDLPQMAQAFSLLLFSAALSSSVFLLIHPAPDLSEVTPP